MKKLFCVELGIRQRKNLCRMTTSMVLIAENSEDAIQNVKSRCPRALAQGEVQRVFEVEHVIVYWPTQTISIVESSESNTRA